MRIFELLNCLLMLPLIVAMVMGGRTAHRGLRVYCVLLLAVAVAHLIREGVHWQMLPAYLAEWILLVWAFAGGETSPAAVRWTGVACLVMLMVSGVLSFLLPMFRLPKPTGQYAVGTRLLYMTDPSRKDEFGLSTNGQRELMVQAWYPAQPGNEPLAVYRRRQETTRLSSYQAVLRTHSKMDAAVQASGAPYPVLLFNPAWTGQRTQSTFLMEELASHGFVVVSIDHTYYSSLVAFPDGHVVDARFAPEIGNFEGSSVEQQDALGLRFVRIEAQDDMFVLDQLQAMNQDSASPFFHRLDMGHVGALGHSIGGAAAAEACQRDPRIQAALNLDGWMFGDVGREGFKKPLMLMYEGDYQEKKMPPFPASGRQAEQQYWQMNRQDIASIDATLQRYGGYRIFIDGASHWNFSDRALYSPLRSWTQAGRISPRLGHEIVNRYAVAFFSHFLKNTEEPILDRTQSEYPEVIFERWKPNSEDRNVAAAR
jgi:dienelactone hydrolase